MAYLVLKALHIVGFVSWFSGLFYLVRLFIYHVEAQVRPEPDRAVLTAQLAIMERRLWFAITVPAMLLTLIAGGSLAGIYLGPAGGLGAQPWLAVKLVLVVGLVGYSIICGSIRNQLASGRCRWNSPRLRMWNELATLLLVSIVIIAVFKSLFDALWGTLGLMALSIALAVAVKLARRRTSASSQASSPW